jgi:hypothetical protein
VIEKREVRSADPMVSTRRSLVPNFGSVRTARYKYDERRPNPQEKLLHIFGCCETRVREHDCRTTHVICFSV